MNPAADLLESSPETLAASAATLLRRAEQAAYLLALSADELAFLPRHRRPLAIVAVLAECARLESSLDACHAALDGAEIAGGALAHGGYLAVAVVRADVARARRLASCPGLTLERAG